MWFFKNNVVVDEVEVEVEEVKEKSLLVAEKYNSLIVGGVSPHLAVTVLFEKGVINDSWISQQTIEFLFSYFSPENLIQKEIVIREMRKRGTLEDWFLMLRKVDQFKDLISTEEVLERIFLNFQELKQCTDFIFSFERGGLIKNYDLSFLVIKKMEDRFSLLENFDAWVNFEKKLDTTYASNLSREVLSFIFNGIPNNNHLNLSKEELNWLYYKFYHSEEIRNIVIKNLIEVI